MTALVVLLTGHFVGDFLCQSDWMATQKSKSWAALNAHVAVYTAVLAVVAAGLLWATGAKDPGVRLVVFTWFTFCAHATTDAVTSRVTSRLWFLRMRSAKLWAVDADGALLPQRVSVVEDLGTRHWFFVMIGFDQLLHVYALACAWWFVTR